MTHDMLQEQELTFYLKIIYIFVSVLMCYLDEIFIETSDVMGGALLSLLNLKGSSASCFNSKKNIQLKLFIL